MCALLHDIGESLGPFNHGEVAAAVLKPFVSENNHWMLQYHPVFHVYFYGRRLGMNPDERERYRAQPHFDRTAEFCALFDEVSFDSTYRSEPMATFEAMVRRVFDKRWTPSVRSDAPFHRNLSESTAATLALWLVLNQRPRQISTVECRWFRPSTAQVQRRRTGPPCGFRILYAKTND